MAQAAPITESTEPENTDGREKWRFWNAELELAGKTKGLKQWEKRGEKIVKRYRDERDRDARDDAPAGVGVTDWSTCKFNILWSNIQTEMPALYAKAPKPIVERRYMDRDPVARTASVILERSLSYEIEESDFSTGMKAVVLDRLLPGRGTLWVRYDPTFRDMPPKTQEPPDGPQGLADRPPGARPARPVATDAETPQEVAYECVAVDYVDWRDFLTSPARTWKEVRWVRKRVYMTRKELIKRFGKDKGEKVTLDWTPEEIRTTEQRSTAEQDQFKKATVYEIWDKVDRKVIWIAKEWSDDVLDEKDDPLRLKDFFPTPRPLYATLTNDSLIPIPDYYEYQDQACELDSLTARINALTETLKVAGCYDASVPELARIFQEGMENKLVPVANWAAFSEKGGLEGGISLLPIKDIMETLDKLIQAREVVKQSLYEITGISDIVRGQSGSGDKTATEQRIKGQFASLRLNEHQGEVARYARDTLSIMGEIIAEHFDPMTLFLISGYEQYAAEAFPVQQVQAPPMAPGMGHNGGPPMEAPAPADASLGAVDGAGAAGAPPPAAPSNVVPLPTAPPQPTPEMLQQQAEADAKQKAAAMFQAAIKLLKDDKLRCFRIDIETDSMIEPDAEAAKQSATELVTATLQGLQAASEVLTMAPALARPIGDLLLFAYRKFRVGRSMESQLEESIDDLVKQLGGPKPPSPEELKAKAEIEKANIGLAEVKLKAQAEVEKINLQREADRETHAAEMEKLQAETALDAQKVRSEEQKIAFKQQDQEREAVHKERTRQMDEEGEARKFAQKQREFDFDNKQAERKNTMEREKHDRDMQGLAARDADRRSQDQSDNQRAQRDASTVSQLVPLIERLAGIIEKNAQPRKIVRDKDNKVVGLE